MSKLWTKITDGFGHTTIFAGTVSVAVRGGRNIADHEEIVRRVLAAPALYEACTGDDDPRLCRLSWAEDLMDELWTQAIEAEAGEDPDAMMEAYGHTRQMFKMLRAALAQADKKEAVV